MTGNSDTWYIGESGSTMMTMKLEKNVSVVVMAFEQREHTSVVNIV